MLEVGKTYRAIGPAVDPPTVEIIEIDHEAKLYRTKGSRQPSGVIIFGCECYWIETFNPSLQGQGLEP